MIPVFRYGRKIAHLSARSPRQDQKTQSRSKTAARVKLGARPLQGNCWHGNAEHLTVGPASREANKNNLTPDDLLFNKDVMPEDQELTQAPLNRDPTRTIASIVQLNPPLNQVVDTIWRLLIPCTSIHTFNHMIQT